MRVPILVEQQGSRPFSISSGDSPTFADEALYVTDQAVRWQTGVLIQRQVSLNSIILSASFVSFDHGLKMIPRLVMNGFYVPKPSPRCCTICVLSQGAIVVYSLGGSFFTMNVPLSTTRFWELPVGLLLQCDDSKFMSVLHPLSEPRPVCEVLSNGHVRSFIPPSGTVVVYVCCLLSFIVLYDPQRKRHSVWVLRRASTPISSTVGSEETPSDAMDQRPPFSPHSFSASYMSPASIAAGTVSVHIQTSGNRCIDPRLAHDYGMLTPGNPSTGSSLQNPSQQCVSEIVIHKIWEEAENQNERCLDCFVLFMRTSSGKPPLPVLGLLSESGTLHLYSILLRNGGGNNSDITCPFDISDIQHVPNIQSASCVVGSHCHRDTPDTTTLDYDWREDADILVLTRDLRFQLLSIDTEITVIWEVSVTTFLQRNNILSSNIGPLSLLKFANPVADRVSLVSTQNGYHCRLSFQPLHVSCALTKLCLNVLHNVLPRPVLLRIRRHMMDLSTVVPSATADWHSFCTVICSIFRIHKHSSSGDSWRMLLLSDHNLEFSSKLTSFALKSVLPDEASSLLPFLSQCPFASYEWTPTSDSAYQPSIIVEALHAVYEELKLDISMRDKSRSLASLMVTITRSHGLLCWCDHYCRDFPDLINASISSPIAALDFSLPCRPVCVLTWLISIMECDRQHMKMDDSNAYLKSAFSFLRQYSIVCSRIQLVTNIISILLGLREVHVGSMRCSDDITKQPSSYMHVLDHRYPLFSCGVIEQRPRSLPMSFQLESKWSRYFRAVLFLVEVNLDLESIKTYPFGVSSIITDILVACRNAPPGDWPAQAYRLVGRDDLMLQFARGTSVDGCIFGDSSTEGNDGFSSFNELYSHDDTSTSVASSTSSSSTHDDGLDVTVQISNLRFSADMRMCEVRRQLRSCRPACLKVVKLPEMTEHEYITAQQHALALLCNRIISLSVGRGIVTMCTLPSILTKPIAIPPLCLSGRAPPANALLALDRPLAGFTEEILAWPEFHCGVAAGLRHCPVSLSAGQTEVIRAWIATHRPSVPTPTHAGFLFGLGLQGHLAVLTKTDLFPYLRQQHMLTTVALLLGIAASRIGTMDADVSRTLCIHIPLLLPPSLPELELPSPVQAAAVMGLGLLYMGSSHRLICEVLLSELSRRPSTEGHLELECYSLCAGMALGLVVLGGGDSSIGLRDLRLEEKLGLLMNSMSNVGASFDRRQQKQQYHASGNSQFNAVSSDSACRISLVQHSCHVTAPGSTMALGLIYMKTNHSTVAAIINIPTSHYQLEAVRPDFILMRIVCRALILWDNIIASEEWIQHQIPRFLRQYSPLNSDSDDEVDVDHDSCRQAKVSIVAGACLAIALRHAGSHSAEAFRIIMIHLAELKKLTLSVSNSVKGKLLTGYLPRDRPCLEACLCVCVMAAAIVMAGSGCLTLLSLIRSLRRRIDSDVTYGHHQYLHLALGLLFIGAGRYSLDTSNRGISTLLCAVYPRFGRTSDETRYYLDALRHICVLGSSNRCLNAVDVATGRPCLIPLRIEYIDLHSATKGLTTIPLYDGVIGSVAIPSPVSVMEAVTPCIIPDWRCITRITVNSDRYWPVSLSPLTTPSHRSSLLSWRCVFVKLRAGCQSYMSDPSGVRSMLHHAIPNLYPKQKIEEGGLGWGAMDAFAGSLSDPSILELCDDVCKAMGPSFISFSATTLLECVANDRTDAFYLYLHLYNTVRSLPKTADTTALLNCRVALAYHSLSVRRCPNSPLLQNEWIRSIEERIDSFFDNLGIYDGFLCEYVRSGKNPALDHGLTRSDDWLGQRRRHLFMAYLAFSGIPYDPLSFVSRGNALVPVLLQSFPQLRVSAARKIAVYFGTLS